MAGLSWSVEILIGKLRSVLESSDFEEVHTGASLLKELEFKLRSLSSILNVGENLYFDLFGRDMLQRVESAVYDAEDVVDGILNESIRSKLDRKSWARGFHPASVKRNMMRKRSLKEIVDLISPLENYRYLFEEEPREEIPLSRPVSLPATFYSIDICCRKEDKNKIIGLLLSDSGEDNLDRINLVGIAGVGKTTLADLVYNDEKVRDHFQLQAWVDVSSDFDVERISRAILYGADCYSIPESKDELQDKLTRRLAEQKFLLVLVVCEEDDSKWEDLQASLKACAKGSKVIVVTRAENLARRKHGFIYHVEQLTVDDCWSILAKSAFAERDKEEVQALEGIGRKIVDKCFGLPLLARAIGGLLYFKKTSEEWQHVLHYLNKLSETETQHLHSILKLSYNDLPAQQKLCFAYCSLFPRGYVFDKEELIVLWMAAGFLQHSTAQSMEQVGAECFNSLHMRSFFMPVGHSRFTMHDLMHDLAKFASEKVYLRFDSRSEHAVSGSTRHLSLPRRQRYNPDDLSVILYHKRLRTFYLSDSPSDHGSFQLRAETLRPIFSSLKRLRVLSLTGFEAELPASIGKLKNLHYLDLSGSTLTKLPESLCTLYHLQTLMLTYCYSLRMLPEGIVKLVNLRKLQIMGTRLKQMPKEMSRLTSLQSLSDFIVGLNGSSIRELGALLDLHGSLSISMLQNVSSASDASAGNLKVMRYVDKLELKWSYENEVSATDQEKVLENLKPSGELKILSIKSYGGRVFPNWLGDSLFLKITSLRLSDCRNCCSLPPLGQLSSLEVLIVEKFHGIKMIGHEFYGARVSGCKPFQSLKTLIFDEMSQWARWTPLERREFPRLQVLYINHCPMLEGDLPKRLPSLIELEISECQQLAALLPRTSKHCVLKLENCDKVQKRSYNNQTNSPQVSPSIGEQDLDESQTKPSSSKDGTKQFYSSSSSDVSMEMPTNLPSLRIERDENDDNQTVFLQFCPIILQQDQDETQKIPSSSKDKTQQFSSSSSLKVSKEMPTNLPSLIIERCDNDVIPTVSPQFTPRIVQRDQDDTQTRSSSSEDGNQQFFSSAATSLNVSTEMPTDLHSLRIERYGGDDNQTVPPQVSPSIVQQDQDGTQSKHSSSGEGNQLFSCSMEMPSDLNTLRIERYPLSMLPKEILERSSLQHLYLIDCIALKIVPLCPSLKTLYICNCKSLEFPHPNKLMNQLQDLCLGSSCDSLETFPLNYFPNLKSLSLWDCRNLESLSVDKELQKELTSLDALEIKDCPKLRSLLEEEVQAPNLTSLVFFNCVSLKSLQQIQSFKSLQSLDLNKCPALECFPMEGLPSGLIILCISFCDKITPQKGWNLDKLHSLSHFEIEGGCLTLKSFPEEGLLPTNLNSLRISRLLNLTSLDGEGLQNLTSLQTLEINSCNKLDSLAEDRLPSSLSLLSITDCSLLKAKLRNRKGKEWFKIAHIPSIHLDEDSD